MIAICNIDPLDSLKSIFFQLGPLHLKRLYKIIALCDMKRKF